MSEPDLTPSAEDMARDLRADLEYVRGHANAAQHKQYSRQDAIHALQRCARIAEAALIEVARLRRQIQDHCDRIAAQSELLSKRAEGG